MRHTVLVIPASEGEVRHVAGPAGVRGDWWAPYSVLGGFPIRMDGLRAIVWSGSFAQVESGGLFDEDPRTWGPKGWAALHKALAKLAYSPERMAIRPHVRHVVSDTPGCKRLLESEETVSLETFSTR